MAVYCADGDGRPQKVTPQALRNPPQRNVVRWNRREIADWLVEKLKESKPTVVGIDHAFSFPIDYFQKYNNQLLGHSWDTFLDDFRTYWPTDGDRAYMSCKQCTTKCRRPCAQCIRCNSGRTRQGEATWRRLTDRCTGTAKSVFQFGVNGSVAHSSQAGLPWLRYIRSELRKAEVEVYFWPFDGWNIPKGTSVIAEVYPALWNKQFKRENRNEHQHDAYSVAKWLSNMDRNGCLNDYFNLDLNEEKCVLANLEGWILGVR